VTTIRAHPPVETPAGLVVALPPLDHSPHYGSCNCLADSSECCRESCRCHLNPPVVFALAVPCPHCLGRGIEPVEVMTHAHDLKPCSRCGREGWVHHGDYQVLEVLSIKRGGDLWNRGERAVWPGIDGQGFSLVDVDGSFVVLGDLPGAVPGGVALVVEAQK
jgi:hypothetical protein